MLKFLAFSLLVAGCLAAPQHSPPPTPVLHPNTIYFVVSAENIAGDASDRDGIADPFVKVYTGENPGGVNPNVTDLKMLDVSETIENQNNPKWNKVFKVDHTPGKNQLLFLEVRDHDPINPDDSIGEAYINLDDFVAKNTYTKELSKAKSGSVTVTRTSPIKFDILLKDAPAMDEFGGLSDPYVKCYFRVTKGGKDWKFYQTERVDNAETVTWEEIYFENYQKGTNQWLHFRVKDHDSITGDDDLGETYLEVDPFLAGGKPVTMKISDSTNGTLTITPRVK